jgi:hypothetical protein
MECFPFLKSVVVAGNDLRQAAIGAGGHNQQALLHTNLPTDKGNVSVGRGAIGQLKLLVLGLSASTESESSAN